jgi:hypothetical protein
VGTCPGQAEAIPAGVRSPPLQGGQAQHRWPYGGRPGDDARGGFLGGTHSVRPRIRATRKPRRVILTDGLTRGWWPERGDIWFSVMPSFGVCGARPFWQHGPSMRGWEPCARTGLASPS